MKRAYSAIRSEYVAQNGGTAANNETDFSPQPLRSDQGRKRNSSSSERGPRKRRNFEVRQHAQRRPAQSPETSPSQQSQLSTSELTTLRAARNYATGGNGNATSDGEARCLSKPYVTDRLFLCPQSLLSHVYRIEKSWTNSQQNISQTTRKLVNQQRN